MKTTGKIINGILGVTFILGLTSCEEKISKIEYEKSLSQIAFNNQIKNDSLERVYITTLDEIDENLDAIRDKHGELILGPNTNFDVGITKKQQILNNVTMINGLIEKNKTKIKSLEKSLAQYKMGKKELVESINIAKQKVYEQEKEMQELKMLLAEKDFKIEDLNKTIFAKDETIHQLADRNKEQENKLNKTYFTYGTYAQLKQKNIVQKSGGLLGIKRVKTLNKNLDKNEFSEIDMLKNTAIPMCGKNPKFITNHPDGTYTLEKKSDALALLTINDPENFWKVSKYLVVEVH